MYMLCIPDQTSPSQIYHVTKYSHTHKLHVYSNIPYIYTDSIEDERKWTHAKKRLKVSSHQIRSAWKGYEYDWIGLNKYKDRGWYADL